VRNSKTPRARPLCERGKPRRAIKNWPWEEKAEIGFTVKIILIIFYSAVFISADRSTIKENQPHYIERRNFARRISEGDRFVDLHFTLG